MDCFRKGLIIMTRSFLLAGSGVLAACGGGADPTPVAHEPALFQTINLTADETTFLQNSIWNGAQVYRETVLPFRNDAPLMRDIVSISKVENVTTGVVYSPSDYSVVNNKLHLQGAIPMLPAAWPNTRIPGSAYASISYKKDGSELRLEWDYFPNQLEVTYQAASSMVPLANESPLPRLTRLIRSQQRATITFVGDSITVGGDSSELLNMNPHQKPWAKLITGYMTKLNPNVLYRNVATGGMDAGYGADQSHTDLQHATDVLVIAYGMNDQAGQRSKQWLKDQYMTMINRVKVYNPNLEVLLVSGFRPETQWMMSFDWWMTDYRAGMIELARDLTAAGTTTVVADVTSEMDRVLQRKIFSDITSNGVNHPNDFGHIVYAQTILHRLGLLN